MYENLTDEEIRILESQKHLSKFKPTGVHPDRVTYDSMDQSQTEFLESQRRRVDPTPTGLHPDRVTYDSMDESQIDFLESQRRRYDPMPTGLHPDRVTYDSMDDSQIATLEAQVREKRQTDIPFANYLNKLADNPVLFDEKSFENAVARCMQSNGIMNDFVDKINRRLSEKTYEFRSIDKSNTDKIQSTKNEIEQLVSVYEKFLYKLKENDWSFSNLNRMKIDEQIYDDLWKIQKNFDIVFNMPIPANMGEYYGASFERSGKMIPGINMMYEDLNGKEVNWHQVMIYGENELTPYQRYKQRMAERYSKPQEEESVGMSR